MPVAAVLYVKDLPTMRAFYARCFGLDAVASDDPGFSVLASGPDELSLVALPDEMAASVTVADPPRRRSSTPIKLVFAVERLAAAASVVAEAGGRPEPTDSAWELRGYRHLDVVDPEGNVVQLRERIADDGGSPADRGSTGAA